MNIKQLQYLQEIALQGSISKAAQSLYISQQALSEMLRDIEDELNFKLFSRSNKGITPTTKGEKVLEDLNTILGLVDNWYKMGQRKDETAHINIAMSSVLSDLIINENILDELQKLPFIHVSFETMTGEQVVHCLWQGKADVGLIYTRKNGKLQYKILDICEKKELEMIEVFSSDMCLVLRADDELAVKEHISLNDLKNKKMVCSEHIANWQDIKKIQKTTGMEGYIVPSSVNVVNFILKHDNSFAYLPRRTMQYNSMIENQKIILRKMDQLVNRGCCWMLYPLGLDSELVRFLKTYFKVD